MSNRRRLPSERAARLRCPKCRGRDLNRKGDDHVCMRCWHIWPVAHPTPSATPAHTDKEA